ncbi:MAG: DUF1648 domain-containing protein [Clostridium sp.]|nr:DUF1648 domain-containing protein [Clostridium sp.]
MKLKYSRFQIIIELFTVILLLSIWFYLIVFWPNIPNRIPTHYNSAGIIDNFGSKNEIFIGPIISTALYIILTLQFFYPSNGKLSIMATEEDRKVAHANIKSMMILTKMEVIIVLTYIFYCTIKIRSLGIWFMPLTLIVFLGTIFYFRFKINNKQVK